jgi:histidine triad (HIT) family protein
MKSESSCIFCQIVAHKAEASVIYEDERIMAFMDIKPVNEGQLLVIPKEHIDHFSDLADELACSVFLKAHHLSRNLRERLQPERVGLVVHGYGVAHAHLIVVPQHGQNNLTSEKFAYIEDGKIKFSINQVQRMQRGELDRLAKLLA